MTRSTPTRWTASTSCRSPTRAKPGSSAPTGPTSTTSRSSRRPEHVTSRRLGRVLAASMVATARATSTLRGSSAIFPTVRRPSRSSSARATSSSGYSVGWTGSIVPLATMAEKIAQQAVLVLGVLHGPDAPVDADDRPVAQQDLVQRDGGDRPGGEADDQVAASVAQRTQRRFGERAADGVDHDVDARAAGPRPGGVLHRLGRGVERRLRPRRQLPRRASPRSRPRRAPGTRGLAPRRWRRARRRPRHRARAPTRPAAPAPAFAARRGRCCSSG